MQSVRSFCSILTKFRISRQNFINFPISNLKEILPLVEANMHVARWTVGQADGRNHITEVTSVDGNYLYVEAPKD